MSRDTKAYMGNTVQRGQECGLVKDLGLYWEMKCY